MYLAWKMWNYICQLVKGDFNNVFAHKSVFIGRNDGLPDCVGPGDRGASGLLEFRGRGGQYAGSRCRHILDQSGNGHHGTATGNPFYRSDVPVNPVPLTGAANTRSLDFDGNGDYVTIGHTAALNPISAFTVEFWMKGAASTGNIQRTVVDKSHGFIDSTGWAFQIIPGGRMALNIGTGGGLGNFPGILSAASVLDDQWRHFAGTYDNSDIGQELKLYIDGVLEGSLSTAQYVGNTRDIQIGAACVWVGCPFSGNTRFLNGGVDELRISNTALTPDQFLNAATTLSEPGALALFGLSLAGFGLARRRKTA